MKTTLQFILWSLSIADVFHLGNTVKTGVGGLRGDIAELKQQAPGLAREMANKSMGGALDAANVARNAKREINVGLRKIGFGDRL